MKIEMKENWQRKNVEGVCYSEGADDEDGRLTTKILWLLTVTNKAKLSYVNEIRLKVSAGSVDKGRRAECLTTCVIVDAVFSSFSNSPALESTAPSWLTTKYPVWSGIRSMPINNEDDIFEVFLDALNVSQYLQ